MALILKTFPFIFQYPFSISIVGVTPSFPSFPFSPCAFWFVFTSFIYQKPSFISILGVTPFSPMAFLFVFSLLITQKPSSLIEIVGVFPSFPLFPFSPCAF